MDQPTSDTPGKRELLARLLSDQHIDNASSLSPEQRRLLMLMQLEPGMPAQLVTGYRLRGSVDIAALQQGLAELTRRHDILRSTFVGVSGRVLRVVQPTAELNVVEFSRDADTGEEEFVGTCTRGELAHLFDPATGPLARVSLLHLGGDEHVLLLTTHELVADEATPEVLVRDLVAVYRSIVERGEVADSGPAGPAHSYAEYARWRQDSPGTAEQRDFWRERLADLPMLQLPSDRRRPATKTYRCGSVTAALPRKVATAVDTDVRSVVLAGFQAVLGRYARQHDVAVGSRVSVRGSRWAGLAGPAGNTLVLRTRLDGESGFAALLDRVRDAVASAEANQDILFGTLVDEFHVQRDLSRTPFFQAMFDFRDDAWSLSGPDLVVAPYLLPEGTTAVDLALRVHDDGDELRLRLDYNADLYDPATGRRLLTHLATLLSAAGDTSVPVAELAMLPADEHDTVVGTWNQTAEEFPRDKGIHQLVEEQVARTPRAVAITCGGASITYQELNDRSNQLAYHLRGLGVEVESRVAICLDRSAEMIIAMLATLKAGGAYVPLDPEYPAERLQFLLADSDAQVLITQRELTDGLDDDAKRVLIDEDWPTIAQHARSNPDSGGTPANLAYLIYTSGSTGRPKGVMITHRGAVNNLTWRQRHWPLTADDRVLQNHSFSFDPSLWATFWPLLSGARMVITMPGEKYDSKALVRLLRDEGITVYAAVPSMNSVLMEEPEIEHCTGIRYVQSGAEALTGSLQQAVFSRLDATLLNFYGPTETTVDSTVWECERVANPEAAPIGRPVANLTAYLLDDHARPVPIGVPGHICIGGVGLARGYHQRPDLTASRFIPDPFGAEPGGRLYRTGDLGRFTPAGTIEFLGRADNQVKVRGYRIELGEVEAALTQHPEVREAVAVVREDTPGDRRLIGYVARVEDSTLAPHAVQAFLEEFLPSYMVPSLVVVLDQFPVTPNGKIDRNALPAPNEWLAGQGEIVEPRTEVEAEVAELFAKALQVGRIGVNQDFFELGGTSLTLARLASQLVNRFAVTMPVHQLFKVPTVEGVAETVQQYQRDGVRTAMNSKHMATLENDAVLADDIRPDGLPMAKLYEPDAVLLTGATGYLGAFMLEDLLARTTADVYCLVRATDEAHALARLRDTMREYLIWDDSYTERIKPLVGDLGRPRLGLSEETWQRMSFVLDSIYHSGATVNFVYPYSALRKPNVGGTQELLRLACTERLKGFHYVSTADVVLAGHMPRPLLEDEKALETPSDDPGGYTGSKWVAEKIANIARRRGIPVNIYRPGLILGHSTTGATQPEDYLVVSFRGFVAMGVIPDYPRILDAVPVDYVAQAIGHISLREDAIGEIYHLFNPAPVSIRRFCDWISTFGYEFEVVPFEEAREKALQTKPGHPLYSMVPLIRDAEAAPQDSLDPELIHLVQPELEARNTRRALAGSGIVCPPANEEQAHLVLRYLIDKKYLESPAELQEVDSDAGE
jgi:amino acid adenylation domain-containing protein/thioester reductase-like protein